MNAPDGPGICFSLAESLHCVWTGCPWIYPNHKKLFIRSCAPSANPVICRVLDLLSKKVSNSAFEGLEMLCHKRRIFFFLFDSTPSLFISRLIASLQSLLLHRTASPHLEQPLLCNISFEPKPEIQKGRREAAAPGGWEHCGFSIKCYFCRFTAACV